MKNILVLSDSHGNLNNMILAVKRMQPDGIIHLGDCWADAEQLRKKFPRIPMEQVPGNCDGEHGFLERVLEIEGRRVMICHGHTRNVKAGLFLLELAAQEQNADVVLFGHTHRVFYDRHNGLTILNPGSIGAPGGGNPPSYGTLALDEGSGLAEIDVHFLE